MPRQDRDERHSRGLVTNIKNPGQNRKSRGVDLSSEVLAVIWQMTGIAVEISPDAADGMRPNVRPARRFLDIKGRDFHNLRHEKISCLVEIWRQVITMSSRRGADR